MGEVAPKVTERGFEEIEVAPKVTERGFEEIEVAGAKRVTERAEISLEFRVRERRRGGVSPPVSAECRVAVRGKRVFFRCGV